MSEWLLAGKTGGKSSMRIGAGVGKSILFLVSVIAAGAQTATPRIVSAANTFLSTLDQKQRAGVLFSFDDHEQRARWSNLPTTMVRRAGLSMGELSSAQRSAALALVSAALSRRGFEKVQQIMEGDEILKTNGKNSPMFGKDLFYISILGTPSDRKSTR